MVGAGDLRSDSYKPASSATPAITTGPPPSTTSRSPHATLPVSRRSSSPRPGLSSRYGAAPGGRCSSSRSRLRSTSGACTRAASPSTCPSLWPHSYYNTRYALAILPLAAFAAGALVSIAPAGLLRNLIAWAVAIAVLVPWLFYPRPDNWVCWKESQVNSIARRAWTEQAAADLAHDYHGGGIVADFGDLTGIFARAGIQLRETLHEGNVPAWDGAMRRPDLMLHEEWAVAQKGDTVYKAVAASPRYAIEHVINVPGAPTLYIWRRH